MLRGLKTLSLTATAVEVKNYAGHALLHVNRDGATGDLATVIEHSDTGSGGWTNSGAIVLTPETDLAGATARAEIDMDKFKRFIRLGSASVGDVTIVAQARA